MYNARIGIGYFMDSNGNNINGCNNSAPLIQSVGSSTYINGDYVGIGTTGPTEKLDIRGNLKVSNDGYIMNRLGLGLSNPSYQLQLTSDSAAKPSSTTWTVTSDIRLKNNITLANKDRCYEILKKLPLKHYSWDPKYMPEEATTDRSKLGWIAQEVEAVFPKAVRTASLYNIEDCKTLDADQIYAAMYGSIQKLQDMVEQLQMDNITMRRDIANLNLLVHKYNIQ
jgi:hypothetical protein